MSLKYEPASVPQVIDVYMPIDRATGLHKGMAFISFNAPVCTHLLLYSRYRSWKVLEP